jgi:GT2 family glycosyltransferase
VMQLCQAEKYSHMILQYAHQPVPGVGAARNKGAEIARAEYLGFVDDDAVLAADWFEVASASVAQSGANILGGPYYPYFTRERPAWYKDQYGSGGYGTQARWLDERQYLSGSNMIIRKSLFERLGGFVTTLGTGTAVLYGEETDFQHRACKSGERIWYNPDLVVEHHVAPKKMQMRTWAYNSWEHGVAKAFIYQGDLSSGKDLSGFRLTITRVRRVIQRFLELCGLLLGWPFSDRRRYPYFQNYFIEKMCPKISSLGLLINLMRLESHSTGNGPGTAEIEYED